MRHTRCAYSKKASWFGAFFFCALIFTGTARAGNTTACGTDHIDQWARVAYIYDGDTIRLSDRRIIRFIAINTPELAHEGRSAQPLAQQARRRLSQLLPVGSRVGLRFGTQHFGPHQRVLAHIFDSQKRNISALLVREGYAFAIAMPPNLWDSRCYFRQEAVARVRHRGIWSMDYYQPRRAARLRTHAGGFYRIRGRISHIGRSRHSLWLDMGRHVAVRIPRKNLPYFSALPLNQWRGKVITVRGWAYYYNHALNLTLPHPAMIETMP
ncbi:MAG: thermonuclease family protein [Gammaproteobacteria bacterium]|jgi:micrococcal nuclease